MFDGQGENGDAVGCSTVAGEPGRTLVGLKYARGADGKPNGVVTRTAVLLSGTHAANGTSDTVTVDPATLRQDAITCGDVSYPEDAVGFGG